MTLQRRWVQCLLAGWYLLASANVPAFALDQLLPQTKTVASADFPCAHHTCGCKTAQQCRLRCCCHPKRRQHVVSGALCHLKQERQAEQPVTVNVSVLSVARCAGYPPQESVAFSAQKLAPHLPPVTAVAVMPLETSAQLLPAPHVLASATVRVPDKVPIQLA